MDRHIQLADLGDGKVELNWRRGNTCGQRMGGFINGGEAVRSW